ncbi:MAG: ribonuclease P protein component 4 [Methanocorpusculum sp.]|nr:ribonuclease P protein component 4 [Methanocorpusculum sp.]
MAKKIRKESNKDIASERVNILFGLAKENNNSPELQKRYIFLAREIAMKQRLRLGKEHKRHFCKKCGSYLLAGKNLRVRVHGGKVIYTCETCGNIIRIPINKTR